MAIPSGADAGYDPPALRPHEWRRPPGPPPRLAQPRGSRSPKA